MINPAMTPDEWRKWLAAKPGEDPDWTPSEWMKEGREHHAAAAMMLHGQPYGFSWADVDELRSYSQNGYDRPGLNSIADRIAALLPPRS